MVQKYTAPVRVYKYPFELVMAAYERRFPTCPLIPVFVGSDKIYENVSDDGAIHVIERRCTINVDAPYLLRKMTGVDHVLFIQKNTLDRRKRVLKIEAWNESFSNHINIHELCFYKANKDNENWTIFEQQASLEVKSFWGFEHVVEKLAVKHYSQNVKKGEEIIEFHIKELADEGITYVAPFESKLTTTSITTTTTTYKQKSLSIDDETNNTLKTITDQNNICDNGNSKNGHIHCEVSTTTIVATNGCIQHSNNHNSNHMNHNSSHHSNHHDHPTASYCMDSGENAPGSKVFSGRSITMTKSNDHHTS